MQAGNRESISRSSSARLNKCDTIQQHALIFDFYGTPFLFTLPDQAQTYRTLLGSVLSIFTMLLVLIYGLVNIVQLFMLSEYQVY